MPWNTSGRREQLPPDWPAIVARIKRRDGGRCRWILEKTRRRCPRDGTDVDHRIPGNDHRDSNLQLLCEFHHKKKSAKEGHAARWVDRTPPLRTEAQPGTLR